MGRLKGKVAVITGASRGIGLGIAEAFAGEGADLFLVSQKSPLDDALGMCRAKGVRAEGMTGDVSDPEFVNTLFANAKKAFDRVDILINNAGITRDGLLLRMKEADFDDVIRVNLKGSFNCLKSASKLMIKQRFGRIINISSVVGETGNAGQVNYSASKAGLIGMTKSAAKELASRGITVNAIAPGYVVTDMTAEMADTAANKIMESIPLGRLGDIKDIAYGAIYLASDEAGYVTGHTLSINGGLAM